MRLVPEVTRLILVTALAAGPLVAQERHWLPDPVLSDVFEDVEGDLFGDPLAIKAAPDGGFLVVDWGEYSIRTFSPDGEPRWRFGRSGEGPGEFSRFLDVEYDSAGRVLVLGERRRLTVLDSDGSLLETTRTPEVRLAEIMPSTWSPGSYALMPRDTKEGLWMAVSSTGRVKRLGGKLRLGAVPPGLPSEAWATPLPDGGAAVVYRWSSRMVLLDSHGRVKALVDGIESIPFPEVLTYTPNQDLGDGMTLRRLRRVDPEAPRASRAVAAEGSRIHVLFGGTTVHAGRIVDTYSIHSGAYMGSYLLPGTRHTDITVLADGRLATLDTEFFPTVRLWRLSTDEGN